MANEENIDPKKVSKTDMQRALELLEREKERKRKIASGEIKGHTWADMTDEQKEKAKAAARKREARRTLFVQKAQAQGITVTDDEVDKFLASKANA